MVYDSVIIGTGPAGISAALTLKANNKSLLLLGSRDLSNKINKAEKIFNYPGLPSVTGKQLGGAFKRHLEEMGIEITDKTATSVIPMGSGYAVAAQTDFYETRTVIIAAGVTSAAAVKNEERFLGKGVSYCASCDGGLYKNQRIAVISTDPRFFHEVEYLADTAELLYFFPAYKMPSDMDLPKNVKLIGSFPVAAEGEERLSGILLKNGERLEVSGLFCLRNCISPETLLSGLEIKDGHIATDRGMRTNFNGCFACGDCTGRPYQYVKAAGEGNIAAHGVIEYLAELK
ncbi:MAG: NAD(P)/FAD-dependent oxidoreductase [Bacteroides sp.]|nr:NAD(P)/FAD-dependent oxidoreductase [Bacteroides sp.]